MNGAKVENAGKYSIASGNEEIIHLCEQNHSSFEDAYETAIEFHRNEIFHYIYENKIVEIDNLEKLGKKCILYCNFDILSFLIKEGMNNETLILDSITTGNLYIVQYFLKIKSISLKLSKITSFSGNEELIDFLIHKRYINLKKDNITHEFLNASENGYIDIFKILLHQEGININAKDINKKTALIYASEKGYVEIVKLLLEQEGIDINVESKWNKMTTFMYAAKYYHIEIVKLLLEQEGIDISNQKFGHNYFNYFILYLHEHVIIAQ